MSPDWRDLYLAEAGELLQYLTKLTADRELASDLVQETFVRGMRAKPQFDHANAARAWLFRTATNLARNDARRRRLIAFVPFTAREPAATGAFDVEADRVHAILRSLPFQQAAALLLHYNAGFQRHEIATLEGVSEETIKSRLARGRKAFIAAYRRLERGLAR